MRLFANLHVLCTLDVEQLQEAFDQQVTIDDTDVVTASQVQSGIVTLAPSATSQQFSFGSVTTADTVLVIAYSHVRLQVNGNTAPLFDAIPVPASAAALVTSRYQQQAQPGLLFIRGKATSIHLTNPSSTVAATAFVAVVGNAV